MEDRDVLEHINDPAHEEEDLYRRAGHGELTEAEHARLKRIEVQLDQAWDLLHQRRARRGAGMDPDDAAERDERTVEGYTG